MRRLAVPATLTLDAIGAATLAAAHVSGWLLILVAFPGAVWLAMLVLLALTSVFAPSKARREASFRTLALLTGSAPARKPA